MSKSKSTTGFSSGSSTDSDEEYETEGFTTTSDGTPIWKGAKGAIPITEMVTLHIKNAINKVEQELSEAGVDDQDEKEAILAALKEEYDARSDKDSTETA